MKKTEILGILFLFVIGLIACNKFKTEEHNHDQSSATTQYTCSMDPQVREDHPGKCPICHMELTPVKNEDSEVNEISLSKQQIQLGNITTQTIATTLNSWTQNYNGVLTINQEKTNTVAARAMGRMDKLYFKSNGEYVKKGEPLYQLYSEDMAIAKQDYFTAYQQLNLPGDFGKNAKQMLNAAKEKLLFYGLSPNQIESIGSDEQPSPYTTIYSPYTGTIWEIITTEGSYVMEGSGIVQLADLRSLWLEAQVNVNYADDLTIGQLVIVSFPDFPMKIIHAKVVFVNPAIHPDTRLLLIRIEIPNESLELKAGMQAIATWTQSNVKAVFIPTDAVIREANASYVWVEKLPDVFESVLVVTGTEINGQVEIKTALDPSKKIVVTGAYAIHSEYKFRKGSEPMAEQLSSKVTQ